MKYVEFILDTKTYHDLLKQNVGWMSVALSNNFMSSSDNATLIRPTLETVASPLVDLGGENRTKVNTA